ncbi:MAG TPA: hypothetical protein PKK06_18130 [Phycisphaerae bacterium]|nr:hypothetical protein [Phycisphaerae bacterium]HNU47141.1 hypothetical protein [Phycisphaerae bacterium]
MRPEKLVKEAAQDDADVVIGQYAYYGNDQRAKKAVTKRGSLDGTTYFFYDGAEVIEEEDGSQALQQQYVWGPNHIDELALIFGDHGTYFAYADANWNVIGLTNPAGVVGGPGPVDLGD